jgi:RNA polymerase sigma-70 factor (ECF subfamily)
MSNVLPEDAILARCRRGDSAAWDELFDAHYSPAGRFIHQLSPSFSPEDVEEISQETFLAVVRHLDGFQGGSSFRTWLFRIAANKARDFIQKQQAAKRGGGEALFSLDAEDPANHLKPDPPSTRPGPDGVLMNAERMAAVRNALDALGDPCREIIELKYFGDLSYQEIASELKLNPKTVSSRLSKCLDKLEQIARPIFNRENMASPSV